MRRAAALLVLGAALPACGGEDLGRPAPPVPAQALEPTNWCQAANRYDYLNILDFEPAGESTAVCDLAGPRQGRCNWYAGSDSAHACQNPLTMLRPTGGEIFPGEAIPGGRCGTPGTALHIVGKRVAACIPEDEPDVDSNGRIGWGANFQVDALPTGPYETGGAACNSSVEDVFAPGSVYFDASCWEGVSFWTKKSGPTGGSALTVTVTDVFTAGLNDPRVGIVCQTAESADDSTKCDAMGRAVSLTEEWNFYVLPWRTLNQKGFGVPSLLGTVDAGNIKGVTLLISPGDWDIWIDDVAFFRAAP